MKYRRIIVFLSALVIATLSMTMTYDHSQREKSERRASSSISVISIEELSRHDGSDPNLPIYIGLDGYVFDVTGGKEFYVPGATYHYLAGRDSSKSLHIMGAEIIKAKYPVIGRLAPDSP
jgi:predicted heme/steroid binding protein